MTWLSSFLPICKVISSVLILSAALSAPAVSAPGEPAPFYRTMKSASDAGVNPESPPNASTTPVIAPVPVSVASDSMDIDSPSLFLTKKYVLSIIGLLLTIIGFGLYIKDANRKRN